MKKINRLLVANRGEIALRVMRSAKEMGIEVVAVYSEADRNAPHVLFADMAFCLGAAPSSESYLLGDKIIQICLENNIDAIHPGYGFLSENADFTRKVNKAGIIFIGPSPEAMEVMGEKISSKIAVKEYNVPLVPGVEHAVEDVNEAMEIAKQIGFPVMVKASAGGGGKGMRIVEEEAQLEEQLNLAINEAISAFGNGAVFIEKYVNSPRHIEIQVLADTHGNIVYLFERECSVQRRHQKVVEEAPSSLLTPEVRKQMGEAAVNVCKSCDYVNAGTVEFIVDDKMNFYFLEMNTRLQVEHPVTEMITGIDLVKEQIRIAQGEQISFKQEDLTISGHALELRVYAENPQNNFLPDIGKLEVYKRPNGNGVRVDDGFEEGMEIPIYYDPMISKLVVHGKDRTEALEKMLRAIREYKIVGIETTLGFGEFVFKHDAFISGNFDTHFVKNYFEPNMLLKELDDNEAIAIAILSQEIMENQSDKTLEKTNSGTINSNWRKNRIYN